jgi:hypothetical protein
MAEAIKKATKKLRSFSLYFLGGVFVLISSLFVRGLWSGDQMSLAGFEKEVKKVFVSAADAACWDNSSAPIGGDSASDSSSDSAAGEGNSGCDANGSGDSCGDSGSY